MQLVSRTIVLLGLLAALGCGGGIDLGPDGSAMADGSATAEGGVDAGAVEAGGLPCCPTGFDLYACTHRDGGAGLACHNPAMGCASSAVCGVGCDPEVSGRCACVQTELCIVGDHFDTTLCRCVPGTP